MNRKLTLRLIVTIAIGVIAVTVLATSKTQPGNSVEVSQVSDDTVMRFTLYNTLTRERMIDETDVVLLGKVTSISPTRWNQDDGTPWQDEATGFGLQLHYVEFEVIEAILDEVGIGQQVTLTVLGASPIDGSAEHDLKVSDQAVIFAVQRELAWRNGLRTVLRLTNAPMNSYFVLREDGLHGTEPSSPPVSYEDLIREIAQRRTTLIQP